MKKIIVFTKAASLNTGFDNFADSRADIKVLNGKSQTTILFFEDEIIFKPTTDFSKEGLYFVYDLIPETDFNAFIKIVTKSDFHILKHGEPKFKLTGFTNVVKGVTEKRDKNGLHYPDVVDILKDEKGDKVKRIFEKVFTFDQREEDFTEAIFKSIYSNESETAIENKVTTRDKYLQEKLKQAK
ncbi:MAG: hypothetical protein IPI31_00115 [Bacteroidetes bacterium]|nr:hypothetical protein [Bacteroidota bacterium]